MEPTLVVADLHADPGALRTILKAATDPAFLRDVGPVERVVNLGDVVGRGRAPRELYDLLVRVEESLPTVWLRGNHEEALVETGRLLSGGELALRAHQALLDDKATVRRLATLPERAVLDDGSVLCVHGGPVDPGRLGGGTLARRTWQRIDPKAEGRFDDGVHVAPDRVLDALDAEFGGPGGLLLVGHEHEELLLERNGDGSAARPAVRPPAPDRVEPVRVDTQAGPVTGRAVDRRAGVSLLARVGLGARRDGEARFGYLRGRRVHLLGVSVPGR